MRACSQETEIISSLFLDKHHKERLDRIIEEIEKDTNYDTAPLWEFQKSLIPVAEHRMLKTMMMPLQFAKDEIEIYNINHNADYVIFYSNKYLEEVIRYFLSMHHPVMKIKYKISNFNSLIRNLENYEFIPSATLDGLKLLHSLKTRYESFDNFKAAPKDAIVTYICSLIIGAELLNFVRLRINQSEKKCLDTLYKLDI